ncbi:hypothetical protein BBJ28_00007818 [Nothophytophthora sp. Chile5]|nr:hypothetical protein BBJ28_00007818 [Nothophytophthora sp. Chile5]
MTSVSGEWEPPLQLWIESWSFDEVMPEPDLCIKVPDLHSVMGGTPTPTPRAAKRQTFVSSPATLPTSTETPLFNSLMDEALVSGSDRDSVLMMLDLEDITAIGESAAIAKCASLLIPPPTTMEPTAKPARRARRSANLDPSGREQRRKNKQRGYEKGYRGRLRVKRAQDEAEWVKLEGAVRMLMSTRTSFRVVNSVGVDQHVKEERKSRTATLLERYQALLQEERVLREAQVFDSCVAASAKALDLWGGETDASRGIRSQMNALPGLRACHTFNFTW